jgi:crotonobetainyl-CoA:carnitine CoA-transferase CaiB-like acyl-CoA transferase
MSQAFAGIRVLDFTQVLAGPFATQQLAVLGADVIKIEQPGSGDQTRGLMNTNTRAGLGLAPSFLTCNLVKRIIVLNLKDPEARNIVFDLVADAHAVVENFRPGVMARLGLDYQSLRERRAGLVYCSISGYGQSGPRADVAAYDGAIQADSGMMAITGHPETGPTRTGYMPVDMATALNTAFALAAALYRRLATGEGQYLDVAMMDTAMVLQAPQISNHLVNGTTPGLLGNRSPTGQPTANVFRTADGNVQIIALRDAQIRSLFQALGCPEALDDPRLATLDGRLANYDHVVALVESRLLARSTADWLALMREHGVPAAPIRALADAVADPQFQHRSVFAEVPAPRDAGQRIRLVQGGFCSEIDGPTVSRAAPTLGEHTAEVLRELGYPASRIEALARQGVIELGG